ncbi:hypothetical protein [Helicobacter sp. 12S02634-8]|uniref:hypothetical protein n=1 Tax=Helicobacter sp. 12S02634-8 TaxID=1476199 RepID=UPI00117B5ECB|nr:hypothetical protein [Helicobacter sp. 12S02634-8]
MRHWQHEYILARIEIEILISQQEPKVWKKPKDRMRAMVYERAMDNVEFLKDILSVHIDHCDSFYFMGERGEIVLRQAEKDLFAWLYLVLSDIFAIDFLPNPIIKIKAHPLAKKSTHDVSKRYSKASLEKLLEKFSTKDLAKIREYYQWLLENRKFHSFKMRNL